MQDFCNALGVGLPLPKWTRHSPRDAANIVPIKVRPSRRQGAEFEVVYGHRRHRACHDLNLDVLVTLEDVNDQRLIIEMEKENSNRKDLSPYERGRQFKAVIDAKVFTSIRELGDAVGCDFSLIAKLIVLASLPQRVVDAFRDPGNIQVKWGTKLRSALLADRDGVLRRAKEIAAASSPTGPKQVFICLCDVKTPSPAETQEDRLIRDQDGRLLATIMVAPEAHADGRRVKFERGVVDVAELEAVLGTLLLRPQR